ncbi:MAG: PEGA domain-containing protein [Myxococcales bacterium]|nr:PEGA domain-containing protein [Myxococcales bacterium]
MTRRSTLALASLLAASRAAALPGPAVTDETRTLTDEVERAIAEGRHGRAAALLRGLETLAAPSPAPVLRSAEVFALAGQRDQAIESYRRYAAAPQAIPEARARAEAEAARLEAAPPLPGAPLRIERATDEAKRLFESAQRLQKSGHTDAAVRLLEAAVELDPELPGPYRVLGALFGGGGGGTGGPAPDKAREVRYLAGYLRLRPDGPIADAVRERLEKERALARLTVEASFPCELLIDGRPVGRVTPVKDLAVPPGPHTVTLVNERYHIARNLRVELRQGEALTRGFEFGVLHTRLEPWARVRVDGKDIGLWDEVGVPAGRHAVSFEAHDGTRRGAREVDVTPGGHSELHW